MDLIKKNPLFSLIALLGILAFLAGSVLVILQLSKTSKLDKQVESAKRQLESLAFANPAPSEYNVEASVANVKALRSDLEEIRDNLKRGSKIETSSDAVSVVSSIQQYISAYTSKAQNHLNDDGEEAPIQTPDRFAFGFERYTGQVPLPENKEVIALLDKQRQVLSYLMDQLIEADPVEIRSVKREIIELPASSAQRSGSRNQENTFKISPEVSARVPGAIETLGFSITFTGYTQSLREFLNSLSEFEMPIVVRSIEVDRINQGRSSRPVNSGSNSLDALFGGAGNNTPIAPEIVLEPVITDTLSSFTVTLEFIDILIPAGNAENPS